MDQLKKTLQFLKKHHFWVLMIVLMLATLVGFGVVQAAMSSQFAAEKAELEQQFQNMSSINTTPQHPNADVIKKVDGKIDELSANVLDAWQKLYEQQRTNNKLPDNVRSGFHEAFEKALPNGVIGFSYRQAYASFIQNHVETLKDIVKYRHLKEDPATAATAPTRRPSNPFANTPTTSSSQEMVGIVEWEENDRRRIEGEFQWQGVPNSDQVRLAQEDLWVYEALLRVIRDTNGAATDYYNAPVKRIDKILIGQAAAAAWQAYRGSVIHLPAAPEEGETYEDPGAAYSETTTSLDAVQQKLDRRYVDDKGEPLTHEMPSPYAEFKMMPICMSLRVAQDKLPRLLSECANSSMPIDVRAVSVRPENRESVNLAAVSSESTDGSGGGGFGGAMASAVGGGAKATSANAAPEEDINVEIYGIIFIFNRPDRQKLATGTAAQGNGEETPATEAPSAAAAPETAATPPTATNATETPAATAPAAEEAPAAPLTPATPGNPAPAEGAAPAAPPAAAPAAPDAAPTPAAGA